MVGKNIFLLVSMFFATFLNADEIVLHTGFTKATLLKEVELDLHSYAIQSIPATAELKRPIIFYGPNKSKQNYGFKQCMLFGDARPDLSSLRFDIRFNSILCRTENGEQLSGDLRGWASSDRDGTFGVITKADANSMKVKKDEEITIVIQEGFLKPVD
ncbi:MAG: hypothetical protein PHE67_00220 [Campylobacterales bacterium]|nr:hypothetical protein [Campylobacterales bacterium]